MSHSTLYPTKSTVSRRSSSGETGRSAGLARRLLRRRLARRLLRGLLRGGRARGLARRLLRRLLRGLPGGRLLVVGPVVRPVAGLAAGALGCLDAALQRGQQVDDLAAGLALLGRRL